jgi:hypothetical protein
MGGKRNLNAALVFNCIIFQCVINCIEKEGINFKKNLLNFGAPVECKNILNEGV